MALSILSPLISSSVDTENFAIPGLRAYWSYGLGRVSGRSRRLCARCHLERVLRSIQPLVLVHVHGVEPAAHLGFTSTATEGKCRGHAALLVVDGLITTPALPISKEGGDDTS